SQVIKLKPDEVGKVPLSVPQGARVELTIAIDLPMGGAMLRVGESSQPAPMRGDAGGQVFSAAFEVHESIRVQALLLSPTGQIASAVPAEPLLLTCTPDSPPTVEMKWPGQDTHVAPDSELKVLAVLADDYGLSRGRVLMSTAAGTPLAAVHEIRPLDKSATL